MTSESAAAGDRPSSGPSALATDLGTTLAGLVDDPDAFVAALERGLTALSDPVYAGARRRVSPLTASTLAVPAPLIRTIQRPLRAALRDGSSSSALWLGTRLERSEDGTVRCFALPCVARALPDEPERTWQLLRRLGTRARDWVEVDQLARPWALGILAEPFRWAELEQLVYSPRSPERRLVGATLATMVHVPPVPERVARLTPLAPRALELVGALIGDAERPVRTALSWALRSWHPIAPDGVRRLLRSQARQARADGDGHRAWVVRDTLGVLPASLSRDLRHLLRPVRRHPAAPSSSLAAATAARFGAALGAVPPGRVQGERYARARA